MSLQGSRRSWAQRSLADGLQNKKRSVALVKNSVGKRRTRKNRVFLPTLAPLAFTMVNTDLIGQARAEGGDPVESVRRGGGG